uniref:LRAT domain-containing protein n=1 Tax=Rhabditophanes sp. KR3021 TaxID=114890 RepID=A0AC35U2Y8_9BILA
MGNLNSKTPRGKGFVSEWGTFEELRLQLEIGDIIEFKRKGYKHFGIYIGNHRIAYFTGSSENGSMSIFPRSELFNNSINKGGRDKFGKCIENIENVALGGTFRINNSSDFEWEPLSENDILENVHTYDPGNYTLFQNNCEHYANAIRYGQKVAHQPLNKVKELGIDVSIGVGILATLAIGATIFHSLQSTPEENANEIDNKKT